MDDTDNFTGPGPDFVHARTLEEGRFAIQQCTSGGDYDVSLIDLQEGVRLMSRVEEIDPAAVRIGMDVKARIVETKSGNVLTFVPA